MNKDRLVISKDKETAVLDGEVKLKAIPATKLCTGCYFLMEDDRCREGTESLAEYGAQCSNGRYIIWVEDTPSEQNLQGAEY